MRAIRFLTPLSSASFIDALRWLTQPTDRGALKTLVVNPHRPNRYEPRVRKRRPKQYPLLTKPRAEWKKLIAAQRLTP